MLKGLQKLFTCTGDKSGGGLGEFFSCRLESHEQAELTLWGFYFPRKGQTGESSGLRAALQLGPARSHPCQGKKKLMP